MAETRNMSESADAHSGHCRTKTFIQRNMVRPNAQLVRYLSEMSGPVYGRPAVEGVLHGEVSRVWGALKEGAQGTDISIPACPMEREAAV